MEVETGKTPAKEGPDRLAYATGNNKSTSIKAEYEDSHSQWFSDL